MAQVPVPEEAYDAADRYLATKDDGQDSLGAVDAAAPFIAAAVERAVRLELCTDLIAAFENAIVGWRAAGDPTAIGVQHCIDHLRSYLDLLEDHTT